MVSIFSSYTSFLFSPDLAHASGLRRLSGPRLSRGHICFLLRWALVYRSVGSYMGTCILTEMAVWPTIPCSYCASRQIMRSTHASGLGWPSGPLSSGHTLILLRWSLDRTWAHAFGLRWPSGPLSDSRTSTVHRA
jgi:hypothetical protein